MNPVRAFPFAFLFGAMAFPQSSGTQFSSDIVRANCPIKITATLKTTGKTQPVMPVKDEQDKGNKQRLEITLSNPQSDMIGAQITIYGLPIGGRIDPAVAYFPHSPVEITKTIAFDQPVEVGTSGSYEVVLPNFSAVTSIDLDSVMYSDGSSWKPVGRKSCRAVATSQRALMRIGQ